MARNKYKGKLIVLEGLDGTGKATQTKMLMDYLVNVKGLEYGKDVIDVDFPRYKKPSATMVEHYLSGKFGNDPDTINPYVASSFYTIDRAISYNTEEWGEVYRNGGLVIADRYTISNIIHQGAKIVQNGLGGLADDDDIDYDSTLIEFIRWLTRYEYNYSNIPCPTAVIVLTMDKKCNEKLIRDRKDNAVEGDIHESNIEYLDRCRFVLDKYKNLTDYSFMMGSIHSKNFFVTTNDENGDLYSREKIAEDIRKIVDSVIEMEVSDD